MTLSRARIGAVAALVLLGGTACSTATSETATDPAALRPGQLLSSRAVADGPALPSAGRNEVITYASQDGNGDPVVVSGAVSIPRTPAPEGGYPVISWAHGTTGVADACAPSADFAGGPAHGYLSGVNASLDDWVAKGYAVVSTDYQGLGTPGIHPYVNGDTETNAVVDIVRAARAMDPAVGSTWFVIGHSQGGQAALFTAAQGGERAPELHLGGAVAIAPGNGLDQTPQYFRSGVPGIEAAEAFLPLILLGAQAADPAIVPSALLTERAQPLLTVARTGCIDDIRKVPPVPAGQVFRPDADLGPLTEYLARQEPSRVHVQVPTLVAQSSGDLVVSKPSTDLMVKTLQDNGNELTYRTYEGADHRGTIGASQKDAQDFVAGILAG
ncbi:alpha/beta hydrolase family protein [Rhodococcus sp. NM-2]|jgi:pimeloyl-ACP methyl ester carboxylesterase|uniref:alpha/beta hydrolase family protein n=1 Tax=Rhodococcus TaxID=1827 RepID=UPI0024741D5B|nr:lipase family protein [Rhodococcus opacus]MDH6288709.1 pimeloyl-ACP methyl ester carboxylesterase [Rhodococcus opacus]